MDNTFEHQVFTRAFPIPVERTRIVLDPATGDGPEVWTATFPAAMVHHEIAVPFGALQQPKDGIGHLSEHLQLNEEGPDGFHARFAPLRARGGWHNGHTAWLQTSYEVRVPADEREKGFEILWDAVFRLRPEQKTFDKQQKIVMLEMLETWESDQQRIAWMRRRLPGEPRFQQVGGGSQEALRAMTLEDTNAWHRQTHRAQIAGFFAAGPLAHEAHVALVCRHLEMRGETVSAGLPREPYPILTPRAFRLRVRGRAPMAILNLTVTPPSDRRENVALSVATSLLTSSGFGVLYKRLRQQEGAIYRIGTRSHHRLFRSDEIGMACIPTDADLVEDVTWRTLRELGAAIPDEPWDYWHAGGIIDKRKPASHEPWSIVDKAISRWRKNEYDDPPRHIIDFGLSREEVSAVIRTVFAKPKVAIRRVVPKG